LAKTASINFEHRPPSCQPHPPASLLGVHDGPFLGAGSQDAHSQENVGGPFVGDVGFFK
jgi:hypothetical protein